MSKHYPIMLVLLILCMIAGNAYGQEEHQHLIEGKKYLDLRIKAIEKYSRKANAQQARLLSKLSRKERKYLNRLKQRDSASYAKLASQPSYDSISTLRKSNPTSKITKGTNKQVDSLRAITRYLSERGVVDSVFDLKTTNRYGFTLQESHINLNKREQINGLIKQRTNALKSGNSGSTSTVRGIKGIEKTSFYGLEKVKVLKQISDEPSHAEEEALETLQGQKDFNAYMSKVHGNTAEKLGGASTNDLENMGYQTKRQINSQFQSRLGTSVSAMQEHLGGQAKEWRDKIKELKKTQSQISQTQQSVQSLNINRPSFKVNPLRGMPFSKRLDKQLNWQTNRATIDGKSTTFQIAGMVGFKHTSKISYGIGAAASIGLGQNWSNIKISFEGIGARSYAAWELMYGIGAYVGYERMFKKAAFLNTDKYESLIVPTKHNTLKCSDAILLGLTKDYRINDKWNGSIQLLYDIWWQEKGLRSPIQLRIGNKLSNNSHNHTHN